jgi:twitching motility two-component system response regulator PilH
LARKILLADDSVTAQNMGRKILTDAGYEVMTVNNGSAALKRVAEQKPDLIVLDVYMPGYSGLEVCQRLKDSRDTSRIPILLTVGKLEPFKPEDARRVAADAFIVKPFEASELLSALTRLEDRIVPQGEGTRFATTVSGIERFAGDPAVRVQDRSDPGEDGWKSRIRFPSKKKKAEEPEPEPDFAPPPSFRDFRDAPAKTAADPTSRPEAPSRHREPGLVPDIPRDITPDELDALSALVAKLDGPIPRAEEIAPIGDRVGPSVTAEAKPEVAAPNSSEAAAPTPTPEAALRTEEVVPAAEVTPVTQAIPENDAESAPIRDNAVAASSDDTPAPVDQDDEPLFASATTATPEPGMEENKEIHSQSAPAAAEAAASETAPVEAASSPAAEGQESVLEGVETEKSRSQVEEMLAEAVAEQAVDEQPAAGEDQIPSDEELAEALRLLTPVHEPASARAQAAASPEQQESPSASSASMQPDAAKAHAGNGSRWLAEAVELSPEEASLSLESEMFRTLAPPSVPEPAVAVEIAIAHADAAAHSEAGNDAEAPLPSPQSTLEGIAATAAAQVKDSAATETTGHEAVSKGIGEDPVQGQLAATFASHAAESNCDSQSPTLSKDETVQEQVEAATAEVSDNQDATGDQQSMAKHAKSDQGKGSKSGWHQIHTAAASSKADVEEAKLSQAEPVADDSPKAMAAAAASDDASSTAAADPSAIASIVDSVLADLRPRIVEEIAKKLAKK